MGLGLSKTYLWWQKKNILVTNNPFFPFQYFGIHEIVSFFFSHMWIFSLFLGKWNQETSDTQKSHKEIMSKKNWNLKSSCITNRHIINLVQYHAILCLFLLEALKKNPLLNVYFISEFPFYTQILVNCVFYQQSNVFTDLHCINAKQVCLV